MEACWECHETRHGRHSFLRRGVGNRRAVRTACLALLATASSASGAEVDFYSGRALPWADAYRTKTIYAADVDGDGDMDVLAGEFSDMGWFENTDGLGAFADVVVDASTLSYPSSVSAADMDGDGDLDIVIASASGNGMTYWLENTDGKGTLSDVERFVYAEGEVNGANWATAADLDGDGSLDILYAGARYDETVGWCKNDGTGTFGEARTIISTTFDNPNMVVAADLNGDDSPDVLVASYDDGRITWFENSGIGSFPAVGVDLISDITGATYVSAADIDGDGDLDVIATFYGNTYSVDGRFMIFENTDGAGTFSDGELVGYMESASSMVAADLDGDLDLDLLGCGESGSVVWYENTDGKGTFSNETVIAVDVDPVEVLAVDIDGDGDLDVVTAVWTSGDVVWYENLRLTPVTPTPSPATASPTVSPTTYSNADDSYTSTAGQTAAPVGGSPSPAPALTVDATDAPIGTTEAPIGVTDAPIGVTEAPIGVTDAPIGVTDAPIGAIDTPAPTVSGSETGAPMVGNSVGVTYAPASGSGSGSPSDPGTPSPIGTVAQTQEPVNGTEEGQDDDEEETQESSTNNGTSEGPVGVVVALVSGGMLVFLARK